MDHVLAQLLHERVFGRLAQLEAHFEAHSGREATSEAIRLIGAWRALLGLHEATESGACRACGPRWRRHMCSVWRVAVAYFVRHDRGYSDA